MIKFIEENDFKSRNVALFGTSGGGEGKELKEMEEQLKIKIKGKFFFKGKFGFINRKKPSDKDLESAKIFAKDMIK